MYPLASPAKDIPWDAYADATEAPVTAAPAQKTSTPSMFSSSAGYDLLQQSQNTAARITPPPPQTQPTTSTNAAQTGTQPTDTAEPSKPTSSITLINPATDQTLTFDNPDANQENIQKYLQAGYSMSEASGAIPSWLAPDGATAKPDPALAELSSAKSDLEAAKARLTRFDVSSDPQLAGLLSGISGQWDARVAEMERTNQSREAAIRTTGTRIGSRWTGGAGGMMGGIITEEERQGIERIGDLQAQKQSALAQARVAFEQQKWNQYAKLVDIAQSHYEDQVNEIAELNKLTIAENKARADAKKQEEKDFYDQVEKPINDTLLAAAKNGAPREVQDLIKNSEDVASAIAAAGEYLQDVPTGGMVGEYLFYTKQAKAMGQVPMDFNSYQDVDANRKRSIAAAGVANDSGMNPKQVTIFNSLVDKQNKSPLIAANDRATILKDVTAQLSKDPKNAALQVSFIYSMIQALDTYQSAVREGEIGLLSSTQGMGEKLQNLPTKIQQGSPLAESKVKEYIAVANMLTNSISSAANTKRKQFSAQAEVAGIGGAFQEYQTAVDGIQAKSPVQTEDEARQNVIAFSTTNPQVREQVLSLAGVPQESLNGRAYTWQEIQQILGIPQ